VEIMLENDGGDIEDEIEACGTKAINELAKIVELLFPP